MVEKEYWLGFAACSGIGPGRFMKLVNFFGSAKNAWTASSEQLVASGIGENMVATFLDFRQKFVFDDYQQTLDTQHISYLTLVDDGYPLLLKQIKNPPFVLFYKGNNHLFKDERTIGVVGTRKITEYGRQVTTQLTEQLVTNNCVIVSGLALGVDGLSHETAIRQHGKTIAVLGCGVDYCYPKEHTALYHKILDNDGLIVSEYLPGLLPTKGSFLARNRIIAGLSQGVVVTEGALQSGSLTTAHHAFSNGRKVFAVPGSIYSRLSAGPYQLIQQGATLITNAKDIIQELALMDYRDVKKLVQERQPVKGETKEEQYILDLLSGENLTFDELVKKTHLDSSIVGRTLSFLEMKGVISRGNEGSFILNFVISS